MSELALQLIEENKRTRDPFLDLGNCGIKHRLPEELLACDWLERLNLGHFYFDQTKNKWTPSKNNKPYNIFKGPQLTILQDLRKLTSLSLRNNEIQDISFIQNLPQLTFLDLSSNQIENINILEKMTRVQTLYLSQNQIQDISFLENLTQLLALDLSYNQIQNHNFLQNLKQLTFLDLSYNQIQKISFLKRLTQIQELHLNYNLIEDISFLQNLTQLQSLYLSYNQIQDISFLQNLTQLQSLDLSDNAIQDISFLQKFTELHSLNLRTNKIKDISILQNLTQLQSLDVRSNQIQDIEPLLFLFKNGLQATLIEYERSGILLYGNPIMNPPKEIFSLGREAIIRHLNRTEQQGFDFIFEAKLTLVGNGGAGKTSLQRRILDEESELPTGNDRTRGIKVHDWQFNDAHRKTYTSHIWDFGGQDVYYPVHRFFLTENSVYILMASTRYSDHNFEYWIPTIYQFGGTSPIIPVQNCDNGEQKDWIDIKPFYGIPEYNLKPIYKIDLSSSNNWGLRNLKGFIQHQITELPHIGKALPTSWVKVREQLIEKAEIHDYISYEKFSDLCLETDPEAFSKAVDIEDLARFLHDLGIILWYYNKDLLRNFVILRPEWAMNAVCKMIDDTIIQEKNGIISQADFNRIWGEEAYITKISELKLMLQFFKIAFPKQHQKQEYLLPARLSFIPEEELWAISKDSLRLEYHFDFMPSGIINQLSADLSNKILSDKHVWSDAVVLKEDNSTAQIVEETHKKKILIDAKRRDGRGLMLLIMNSMSNIINEYRGVVPSLKVPCRCNDCQLNEKPTIFEYEKLIDWLNNGRKEVTCNESEIKLSIADLLYSVGLKHTETKKRLQKQVNPVKKNLISVKKKVFVTYSWTDKDGNIDEAHHTQVHQLVNVLIDRGFEATFDKKLNETEGAIDFTKMMVQNIEKNDRVIVVLSEGYAHKANDSESSVEFEYSMILNDIKINKHKYILVTFSDRKKDIYPFAFRNRDTIDLSKTDPKEIDRLLRKLEGTSAIQMPRLSKRVAIQKSKDVGKLF